MKFKAKHLMISGTVQGVGFRKFTCRMAKDLSLKGWVRNLKNGQVEAMIQGDDFEFEQMLDLLKQGPPMAKVEDVLVYDIMINDQYDVFEDVEDGEQAWQDS